MKTFDQYIKENDERVVKWGKLLDGIDLEEKLPCAKLLENQLETNKYLGERDEVQFRRVSIPLARRVFAGVDVEISSKPLSKWVEVASWNFPCQQDGHGGLDLDAEALRTADLAEEIAKNINESDIKKIHNFRITRNEHYTGKIEVNCE